MVYMNSLKMNIVLMFICMVAIIWAMVYLPIAIINKTTEKLLIFWLKIDDILLLKYNEIRKKCVH